MELIHGYSLVHDDMPCMDNDVLRRGKPTVHVQFGEAQAMLVGDYGRRWPSRVLTLEVRPGACLASSPMLPCFWRCASGHAGMAGGQAIDLASVGQTLGRSGAAQRCTASRPASCCTASVMMGARLRWRRHKRLRALGLSGGLRRRLGLAFQVVDDILDVTQASTRAGQDRRQGPGPRTSPPMSA